MSSVNSMIETVSSIFNSANSVIDSMDDGNRMQLKELAQVVADKSGTNPQDCLTFVTYFARNTDLGYISRGKNGGFIKGKRKEKGQVALENKSSVLEKSEIADDSDDLLSF